MASVPAKKSTAFSFSVALPSQAGGGVYQDNPTLAAGDVQVSIDGGSFVNIDSLPVAIDSSSTLIVSLTAAEMNGDYIFVRFRDVAGVEWCDVFCEIFTVAQQIDDLASQASVNDLPTNAELATALGTADDAVLAEVALVKAKTDSLTFTVPGKVDSNIRAVNDVSVTGDGSSGTPWGP